MSNFSIRIDLLKLKGAFLKNIKGTTATKRCLIIPVDDCDGMFLGEKGCYLNLNAIEMQNPQFNDTHCVKVNIPKEQREAMTEEQREAMTEEQRNAVPILGGLRPLERKQETMQVNGTLGAEAFDPYDGEDLPF